MSWLAVGAALALLGAAPAKDGGRTGMIVPQTLKWPDLKVIGEVDVPGITRSGGRAVHLHALKVKGKLEDVFRAYQTAFAKAGYYLPPPGHISQLSELQPNIAALDFLGKKSWVVILEPYGREVTGVILGMVDLSVPMAPMDLNGLPVMPGATGALRTDTETGSVVTFDVPGRVEDAVLYYRKELAREGYHEPPDSNPLLPRFIRPGQELQLRVGAGSRPGTTHVTLMQRSREEQDGMAPEEISRAQVALENLPGPVVDSDAGTRR